MFPIIYIALRLKNDIDFTGIEASTIDKLLADIDTGKRTKASVLNINNIIIDEMSMVDLEKFHLLLELINYKAPSFAGAFVSRKGAKKFSDHLVAIPVFETLSSSDNQVPSFPPPW